MGLNLACSVAIITAILSGVALAASPTLAPDRQADPREVDTAVRPGDDFYRYANGAWLSSTPLPQGRSRYDAGAMLRDRATRRVRNLLEEAATAATSAGARRIGDFYASMTDVAGIEAKGIRPLSAELAAIAAIRDRRALCAYLGRTLRLDDGTNTQTDGLFGVWIHQGFHDADHYAAHLVQGGLGLPDREDYLDTGAEKAAHRDLYRAHIAAILKLAGFDRTDVRAARILALEIAIAGTHASADDTADVFKTDNPWRRADFVAKAPGLDWIAWFKAARLDGQAEVIVWQPSAVTGEARLVGSQPITAWKDYLAFHLIAHSSAALPKAFGEANAAFAGRLSGRPPGAPVPTPEDRKQQAIAATTQALGEDIGQLYVARYFPPQAKAAAAAMVENIRTAFRARIAGLSWMSPATRETALTKLAAVRVSVGYPDTWIDYSALVVRRDDAYGNARRAEAFAYRTELAKLGRPVDPRDWLLVLPQHPGANINFSPNALQFSASLLEPPFFDALGDAAANYGSAGAGMAHEISHSFDELGSIYDARGRLIRWWTGDDLARYRSVSAPLAAQFSAYCPKPDLCVRGQQVLGENIADLAGLRVAHDAYLLSLRGKPDVVVDGLTGDQRFFLAFARRWRVIQTEPALRQQIATDPHAPGEFRADTVRNLEDWRRALDVKPGDKLYLAPDARVGIW